jgi:hypothetical protein
METRKNGPRRDEVRISINCWHTLNQKGIIRTIKLKKDTMGRACGIREKDTGFWSENLRTTWKTWEQMGG